MCNKPLDLTKPVQTRDGRGVCILWSDRKGHSSPIIGLVLGKDGVALITAWGTDGRVPGREDLDLVNVPVVEVRYRNIYPLYATQVSNFHVSLERAKYNAFSPGAAVEKITFEDGIPVAIELIKE